MKLIVILTACLSASMVVFLLCIFGLSNLFRSMGWPKEALVVIGIGLFLLAGIFLCAWRWSDLQEIQQLRKERIEELEAEG